MLYTAFFSQDGTVRISNTATLDEIVEFVEQFGCRHTYCSADTYRENIKTHFPEVQALISRHPKGWKAYYPSMHQTKRFDTKSNDSARKLFAGNSKEYNFYGNFVLSTKG